ncbi:MAG TPA: hypothetical protein VLV81_13295 [Acidimicrobiia bacterium]|nr:hypothetical protein [Acidimicrobiia bacterium]
MRTATALLASIVVAAATIGAATAAGAAPSTEPGAALLAQIPSTLRVSCQPAAPSATPHGAAAAVTCAPRRAAAQHVLFLGFPDPAAATARYLHDGDRHLIPRDTNGDCFSYADSESPFRGADGVVGRLFCAHKDHSIEWTYGTVVARATGANSNDLYTWWAHLVARTLDATQRALFNQVPAAIDRTNCQDNGDASIKCTTPAGTVIVAKYNHYPTPDAVTAAYQSALAGQKQPLNVPPRKTKNVCAFETPWHETTSQQVVGRVACFHSPDGSYHFLWTDQLTMVEAYGPSLSDVTNFFKSFPTAGQAANF